LSRGPGVPGRFALHLRALAGPRERPEPVRARPAALAEEGPKRSPVLGALVPLILVLMTMTGAVYPAIDLTAGERERGTLEVLVAAPVHRLQLLFAKYVTVLTVAVLTAVVNLVTMSVTLQVSGLGELVFGQAGLPLVSIVPLLNIVLLTREVLEGTATLAIALLVVAATLVYALAAIALAARIFGAEAVLYNEQASWSDLFRRPPLSRPTPTISAALFCLAIMFPISFVLIALLAHLARFDLVVEVMGKVAGNVALF